MNEKTIFTYENTLGKLTFAYEPYQMWINEITGASGVEIDISESRSSEQVGASVASESVQPRSIAIDGQIFEPLSINRKSLLRIMAPRVPSTLTAIEEDGQSWYLDVILQRTPEITPGRGTQFFQAVFYAAYPYWRTTASYSRQIAGLISMFKFPFFTGGKWWISKFSDNYFATVENQGNVPAEFRVVFTARSALKNPELYHVDTQKRIKIVNKSMLAGERIVVSTIDGQRGVTCISASGEITNGFKYLSVDSELSMALMPGPNLLRTDADTNREGLGVRVEAPEGVKSGV